MFRLEVIETRLINSNFERLVILRILPLGPISIHLLHLFSPRSFGSSSRGVESLTIISYLDMQSKRKPTFSCACREARVSRSSVNAAASRFRFSC